MDFMLGNAIKYIWRAGNKNDTVEDLEKARWYLGRKITELLEKKASYRGYTEDHTDAD